MKDEWQTDTIIIIQEIPNIKLIKPQTNVHQITFCLDFAKRRDESVACYSCSI